MKKEIETLKKNWKNNAVISGLPVVGKSTEEVKEIVKKIATKLQVNLSENDLTCSLIGKEEEKKKVKVYY